jgi:hypothetical protein
MMPLSRVPVHTARVKDAAVTDDAVVITIIEWAPEHNAEANNRMGSLQVDVMEHDSFTDATNYLLQEAGIITGDWDRIHLINPERLR